MPGRNTGTNTIFFIRKADILPERWKDIAFSRIVCNVRPQKSEVNRTRLTYGGSNLDVPMDCGTPTADLITIKLLLNSVISTKGARFMCIDLKDFYLNTPMDRPEYLRMKLAHFPQDVIDHYNLNDLVDNKGFVYVRCERGMYGLPHAGIIAQQLLEKRLAEHGYHQSEHTPGFWTHEWRPICFSLIVDDFGVKYVGREHAEHLLNVLKKDYVASEDWEGEKYAGIDLDWDYEKPMRPPIHAGLLQRCTPDSATNSKNTATSPTDMKYQSMAKPCNTRKRKIHHRNWTKRKRNSYNRSPAPFSTTHVASTQPCSWP